MPDNRTERVDIRVLSTGNPCIRGNANPDGHPQSIIPQPDANGQRSGLLALNVETQFEYKYRGCSALSASAAFGIATASMLASYPVACC